MLHTSISSYPRKSSRSALVVRIYSQLSSILISPSVVMKLHPATSTSLSQRSKLNAAWPPVCDFNPPLNILGSLHSQSNKTPRISISSSLRRSFPGSVAKVRCPELSCKHIPNPHFASAVEQSASHIYIVISEEEAARRK